MKRSLTRGRRVPERPGPALRGGHGDGANLPKKRTQEHNAVTLGRQQGAGPKKLTLCHQPVSAVRAAVNQARRTGPQSCRGAAAAASHKQDAVHTCAAMAEVEAGSKRMRRWAAYGSASAELPCNPSAARQQGLRKRPTGLAWTAAHRLRAVLAPKNGPATQKRLGGREEGTGCWVESRGQQGGQCTDFCPAAMGTRQAAGV